MTKFRKVMHNKCSMCEEKKEVVLQSSFSGRMICPDCVKIISDLVTADAPPDYTTEDIDDPDEAA